MALQTSVGLYNAVAVPGDIAVPDQAMYYPRNLLADENGIVCGTFVFIAADGAATNTVTNSPIGIAQRNLSYPIYDVTSPGTLTIPEGHPVMTVTQGDIYVQTTTAATVGQKVFVGAGGVIATGDAGGTVSGATETDWTVAIGGEVNDTILIYKH